MKMCWKHAGDKSNHFKRAKRRRKLTHSQRSYLAEDIYGSSFVAALEGSLQTLGSIIGCPSTWRSESQLPAGWLAGWLLCLRLEGRKRIADAGLAPWLTPQSSDELMDLGGSSLLSPSSIPSQSTVATRLRGMAMLHLIDLSHLLLQVGPFLRK
eukprot:g35243.t1